MNKQKQQSEQSRLPHNRWQVFADRIQTHWLKLWLCGLLLLLFSLPLFAVRFTTDLLVTAVREQLQSNIISQDTYEATVQTIQLFSALINVVSYIIFGIGIVGILRQVRKMAWSEPVSFWGDFSIGVKQNKGGLLCFLAIGLLNAFNSVVMQNNDGLFAYVPLCAYVLILLPIILHILVQLSIYNHKAWDLISSSAFVYIKTLPVSVLFSLLFMAYGLLDFVGALIPRYLLKAVFVMLLPTIVLGWFIYCCSALDKYINKQSYPELVDKGVWRLDK